MLQGWPGIRNEGISGGYTVVTPQFVKNRCNEKVAAVASYLLGETDLLVNHDRFGIFRPTKGSAGEYALPISFQSNGHSRKEGLEHQEECSLGLESRVLGNLRERRKR